MMIQGTLVIRALPGSCVKIWIGPGEEVAPKPIAVTRSAVPSTFQSLTTALLCVEEWSVAQATGSANAPTRMSPQPAIGANGAGKRPLACSKTNETPSTRTA